MFFWDDEWDDAGRRRGDDHRGARRAAGHPAADDPINIQYTSGTTGYPKGATLSHRNILNNGCFVAALQGFTSADRVCIPVPFYHCFGMVMGNLGCTTHGATMVIPNDAFDPLTVLRDGAGRAVHGAVRRADDVHRRTRPRAVRRVRPVEPAHRRDGRIAVPGRGDEAVHRPDAHGRRDHLLRHDRDVAGVDPDAARRHARPPDGHRRSGPPARRDPHRRPVDRRDARPRRDRASSAPAATR